MYKQIVARYNESIYNSYLKQSIERHGIISCDVHNENNSASIFQKYNGGINAYKNDQRVGLHDEDIIGFIHEDVKILDNEFIKKINYIFEAKKDLGLLGVCGTTSLDDTCRWWNKDKNNDHLKGHLIQEDQFGKTYHSIFGDIGYFDNMVVVDGFFFAIRGELINKGLRFDENYSNYDLYDLDICISVLQMGYKIGVADILLQHKSIGTGVLNINWEKNKNLFLNKFSNKYKFPIDVNQFNINKNNTQIEMFEV